MKALLAVVALVAGGSSLAAAQDPLQVDPKHYHLIFEDAQIRVLHIVYGPHEKSVMHEHPVGTCVIMLTDADTRFHTPDGKFTDMKAKAGDTTCTPAGPGKELHNPENLADATFTAVLVERKVPPAP